MTRVPRGATSERAREDERLNEEFNSLLRDAADKREERSLVQSSGDAAAAKQESADLLALARAQASPRRKNTTGCGRARSSEPPTRQG
jgi:hypothetical protein